MKTLQEVRSKYAELLDKYKTTADINLLKKNERSKLNKEASFLAFVIKYLDSNPKQEWLLREKNKLEMYLASIEPRFDRWRDCTPHMKEVTEQEARQLYYKKMLKQKKEKQLRTINYILA